MSTDVAQTTGPDENQASRQVLARTLDSERVFREELHVPQFGVIHLLLWMTFTAALLGMLLPTSSESAEWSRRALTAMYSIMLAAGLVGTIALIRARCYEMLERLQPGHWLVLILTSEYITAIATWVLAASLRRTERGGGWLALVPIGCCDAILAIGFAVAICYVDDDLRWTRLFGLQAVASGSLALALLAMIAIGGGRLATGELPPAFAVLTMWACCWPLVLPWAIIVAIRDWSRRTHRDWVHCLGVVLFCLGYSVAPIMIVVSAVVS